MARSPTALVQDAAELRRQVAKAPHWLVQP
jgi:hypothetical protein